MEKITTNPKEFNLQIIPDDYSSIWRDDNGVYYRIWVSNKITGKREKQSYHTREQRDREFNYWASKINKIC